MYKISEFSKITNISVKALRYYDEEKILQPSSRGENNYRLYDETDYNKAKLIGLLRSFDFSIIEVRDVLSLCENEEDLPFIIKEKIAIIETNIKKEKTLISSLEKHLIKMSERETNDMNYIIEIKEIPSVKVASIRFQGSYSDVGKYIGTIYKEVMGNAAGAPFNCYYDECYQEIADIELCVPIKKSITAKSTTVKQLPPISAICTTHVGSYETLNLAYKALLDYTKANSIECDLPSREIYQKGPGSIFKGNPDKYVTDIMFPIKRK